MNRCTAGRWAVAAMTVTAGLLAAGGCDDRIRPGGGLFQPQGGKDLWTIRCVRLTQGEHAADAQQLATMLKQVKQLEAAQAHIKTDNEGSTVYYGQYQKVPAASGSQLVFPPAYQRDVELIRSLAYGNGVTPFFTAQPEPLAPTGPASGHPEWEIGQAKGTHSLLVAVFYNTPEFDQRREAAEQYVEALRKEGVPAYYYHEAVKSFVFLGDFNSSDLIRTRDGSMVFGPRVEAFINRRPDEFRYFTENGFQRKVPMPNGQIDSPRAQLMLLPGKSGAALEPAAGPDGTGLRR